MGRPPKRFDKYFRLWYYFTPSVFCRSTLKLSWIASCANNNLLWKRARQNIANFWGLTYFKVASSAKFLKARWDLYSAENQFGRLRKRSTKLSTRAFFPSHQETRAEYKLYSQLYKIRALRIFSIGSKFIKQNVSLIFGVHVDIYVQVVKTQIGIRSSVDVYGRVKSSAKFKDKFMELCTHKP